MATIQQRNGKYRAIVRRSGQTVTQTFTAKKDAQTWARKTESEIERGLYLDISSAQQNTVQQAIDRYIKEVLAHQRSYHVYRHHLKPVSTALGHLTLSALKPAHVASYRDARSQKVSPATVSKELALLNRVVDLCIKEWNIPLPNDNPVASIRKPKQPPGRTRRLLPGEESRITWALAKNPPVLQIVRLALETAMRREEITRISWEDINLKARTLHIPRTKTDTPRTIPLSSQAVELLSRIPRNISGGQLFDLQPASVTQAFNRACQRAGIEGLHFHDLRHEATSRLFERGLQAMEVAHITGHKDLKMLFRYTHLKAEDLVAKVG